MYVRLRLQLLLQEHDMQQPQHSTRWMLSRSNNNDDYDNNSSSNSYAYRHASNSSNSNTSPPSLRTYYTHPSRSTRAAYPEALPLSPTLRRADTVDGVAIIDGTHSHDDSNNDKKESSSSANADDSVDAQTTTTTLLRLHETVEAVVPSTASIAHKRLVAHLCAAYDTASTQQQQRQQQRTRSSSSSSSDDGSARHDTDTTAARGGLRSVHDGNGSEASSDTDSVIASSSSSSNNDESNNNEEEEDMVGSGRCGGNADDRTLSSSPSSLPLPLPLPPQQPCVVAATRHGVHTALSSMTWSPHRLHEQQRQPQQQQHGRVRRAQSVLRRLTPPSVSKLLQLQHNDINKKKAGNHRNSAAAAAAQQHNSSNNDSSSNDTREATAHDTTTTTRTTREASVNVLDGGYIVFSDSFVDAHPQSMVAAFTQAYQQQQQQQQQQGEDGNSRAHSSAVDDSHDSSSNSSSSSSSNDMHRHVHASHDVNVYAVAEADNVRLHKVHTYLHEAQSQSRPLFRRRPSDVVYGSASYIAAADAGAAAAHTPAAKEAQ